jgi:hypothetical protein
MLVGKEIPFAIENMALKIAVVQYFFSPFGVLD